MAQRTIYFDNGNLTGGLNVWSYIKTIIPDNQNIIRVTSHDNIWEVVIEDKETEAEDTTYDNDETDEEYGHEPPEHDYSDDYQFWDTECKMCGRERSVNDEGYCSSCWQIWNS